MKKLGSSVVSIVNVVDSSIARLSDKVLYTRAGPEIGVASTKAFVTQMAMLYLFAIAVAIRKGTLPEERASLLIEALREIPQQVERSLEQESAIETIAKGMTEVSSTLFLGRGYGLPAALEGALKLKEISYIHAEGYAAGEMKHGPIALIDETVPTIAVATKGPLYEKIISNIQEVRARKGHVIAIASEGDTQINQFADTVILVPEVNPLFAPFVVSGPLQLLSYYAADLRGKDVDMPRNLAKSVTVE